MEGKVRIDKRRSAASHHDLHVTRYARVQSRITILRPASWGDLDLRLDLVLVVAVLVLVLDPVWLHALALATGNGPSAWWPQAA